MVTSGIAADITALLTSTSARTLIVGIDKAGRILQHDRAAGEILAEAPGSLLGAELSTIVTASAYGGGLQGLIDAASSDREGTAVMTVKTGNGHRADAVVTVQPVRSADTRLLAQVILRIAPPSEQRFLDPTVMRHALLDGAFSRTGGELDIDQMSPALVNIIVPHFCNSAELLVLESLVGADEFPGDSQEGLRFVRRLAIAHDDDDPGWDAAFPTGEILSYPPDSPHNRCLESGKPIMQDLANTTIAEDLARAMRRKPVGDLLAGTSMLLLPLIARETTLGFFACVRYKGYRRFDAYDAEIGMEFASRAAIFIDNARRYSRERATALTLQRSLLPTGLSAPSSVEVRHRYLPGSKMIEVGGDWYESIVLPGGRVALVVGDVAGHGVRAAVTMGRLRTAIKTLARLELPPAETLQQLDELMHELGQREPHFATCVYAVFDAVSGTCEVASAGHLPPLLVSPDGEREFLDVAPAPPLGIGSGPIHTRVFKIRDGSLLVLYTDGLVERRTADIDEGLTRLRDTFGPGSTTRPLEELCKATLAGVYADHQRDDIAVLMARLRRLTPDQHVTWKLASELTSARRARMLVRRRLRRWGLAELIPTAELLASELVTNAVRYAQGPIALRLVREGGLVCEVFDDSAALPRLRHAGDEDERGRGLQVVSQLAQHWGARRTPSGKVVWCELPLPHS
ncbi:MAG TPA: SpoIIE family protein phosphatase [Streptosporangiaceae bacterium]|nr:SpoIIE family protein phosphatase [Streptosporangiaceae bacterium]